MKLGLALSSGSFRGLIQIGMLLSFDSAGLEFYAVTGASIGSLVGASYASGFSAGEIVSIAEKIDLKQMLGFLDLKMSSGVIGGANLMKNVEKFLREKKIEKFRMGYGAVATNISNGKPYFFTKGYAKYAIRASTCLPVVFKPFKYKGMRLIDGGVVDPLPADLAFRIGADKVVGINVAPEYFSKDENVVGILKSVVPSFQQSIISWQKKYYGENLLVIEPQFRKFKISDYFDFQKIIKYGERSGKRYVKKIERWMDERSG